MSERVLKTLACRGLRVGPSKLPTSEGRLDERRGEIKESVILWIEAQRRLILTCLKHMFDRRAP